MNHDNMFTMADGITMSNSNRDKYGQNPLATREMYAVKTNRSVVKSLRHGIVSLLTTIKLS